MRKALMLLLVASIPSSAIAQMSVVRPSAVKTIGPKQDDPLACPSKSTAPSGTRAGSRPSDPSRTIR